MAKTATLSTEQMAALVNFVTAFELVFHDDWDFTRMALNAEPPASYIAPEGTFLEPGVEDPSNNNGNRGALLASYQRLIEQFPELQPR